MTLDSGGVVPKLGRCQGVTGAQISLIGRRVAVPARQRKWQQLVTQPWASIPGRRGTGPPPQKKNGVERTLISMPPKFLLFMCICAYYIVI